MIYSTFTQLKAVYMILLAGAGCSLLIFLLKSLFIYNYSSVVVKNIQSFIFSLVIGFWLILFINLFNYGEYNIILVMLYLIEINWINKRLRKLLDFFSSKVYNCYKHIIRWEKYRRAGKIKSITD